eukprot:m.115826 g.115826  ORF g.115826 m.115826 type:complete len:1797 (+) comp14215_c0_seq2:3-5393(+)
MDSMIAESVRDYVSNETKFEPHETIVGISWALICHNLGVAKNGLVEQYCYQECLHATFNYFTQCLERSSSKWSSFLTSEVEIQIRNYVNLVCFTVPDMIDLQSGESDVVAGLAKIGITLYDLQRKAAPKTQWDELYGKTVCVKIEQWAENKFPNQVCPFVDLMLRTAQGSTSSAIQVYERMQRMTTMSRYNFESFMWSENVGVTTSDVIPAIPTMRFGGLSGRSAPLVCLPANCKGVCTASNCFQWQVNYSAWHLFVDMVDHICISLQQQAQGLEEMNTHFIGDFPSFIRLVSCMYNHKRIANALESHVKFARQPVADEDRVSGGIFDEYPVMGRIFRLMVHASRVLTEQSCAIVSECLRCIEGFSRSHPKPFLKFFMKLDAAVPGCQEFGVVLMDWLKNMSKRMTSGIYPGLHSHLLSLAHIANSYFQQNTAVLLRLVPSNAPTNNKMGDLEEQLKDILKGISFSDVIFVYEYEPESSGLQILITSRTVGGFDKDLLLESLVNGLNKEPIVLMNDKGVPFCLTWIQETTSTLPILGPSLFSGPPKRDVPMNDPDLGFGGLTIGKPYNNNRQQSLNHSNISSHRQIIGREGEILRSSSQKLFSCLEFLLRMLDIDDVDSYTNDFFEAGRLVLESTLHILSDQSPPLGHEFGNDLAFRMSQGGIFKAIAGIIGKGSKKVETLIRKGFVHLGTAWMMVLKLTLENLKSVLKITSADPRHLPEYKAQFVRDIASTNMVPALLSYLNWRGATEAVDTKQIALAIPVLAADVLTAVIKMPEAQTMVNFFEGMEDTPKSREEMRLAVYDAIASERKNQTLRIAALNLVREAFEARPGLGSIFLGIRRHNRFQDKESSPKKTKPDEDPLSSSCLGEVVAVLNDVQKWWEDKPELVHATVALVKSLWSRNTTDFLRENTKWGTSTSESKIFWEKFTQCLFLKKAVREERRDAWTHQINTQATVLEVLTIELFCNPVLDKILKETVNRLFSSSDGIERRLHEDLDDLSVDFGGSKTEHGTFVNADAPSLSQVKQGALARAKLLESWRRFVCVATGKLSNGSISDQKGLNDTKVHVDNFVPLNLALCVAKAISSPSGKKGDKGLMGFLADESKMDGSQRPRFNTSREQFDVARYYVDLVKCLAEFLLSLLVKQSHQEKELSLDTAFELLDSLVSFLEQIKSVTDGVVMNGLGGLIYPSILLVYKTYGVASFCGHATTKNLDPKHKALEDNFLQRTLGLANALGDVFIAWVTAPSKLNSPIPPEEDEEIASLLVLLDMVVDRTASQLSYSEEGVSVIHDLDMSLRPVEDEETPFSRDKPKFAHPTIRELFAKTGMIELLLESYSKCMVSRIGLNYVRAALGMLQSLSSGHLLGVAEYLNIARAAPGQTGLVAHVSYALGKDDVHHIAPTLRPLHNILPYLETGEGNPWHRPRVVSIDVVAASLRCLQFKDHFFEDVAAMFMTHYDHFTGILRNLSKAPKFTFGLLREAASVTSLICELSRMPNWVKLAPSILQPGGLISVIVEVFGRCVEYFCKKKEGSFFKSAQHQTEAQSKQEHEEHGKTKEGQAPSRFTQRCAGVVHHILRTTLVSMTNLTVNMRHRAVIESIAASHLIFEPKCIHSSDGVPSWASLVDCIRLCKETKDVLRTDYEGNDEFQLHMGHVEFLLETAVFVLLSQAQLQASLLQSKEAVGNELRRSLRDVVIPSFKKVILKQESHNRSSRSPTPTGSPQLRSRSPSSDDYRQASRPSPGFIIPNRNNSAPYSPPTRGRSPPRLSTSSLFNYSLFAKEMQDNIHMPLYNQLCAFVLEI